MTGQCRPINVTGTGVVFSGPCSYRGFSLFSTAGATVTLYDNTAASGTVLAKMVLGANGSAAHDSANGVRADNGIYVVASAAVEGHVRIG